MKRPSVPPQPASPLDPAQIADLADHALAGDVVQPGSIDELVSLLRLLRQRGYELKRRTEWEEKTAPWLFLIVPSASPNL